MRIHNIALFITYILFQGSSSVAQQNVPPGGWEYGKFCPTRDNQHVEVTPGYEVTVYCDTLPLNGIKQVHGVATLKACANVCGDKSCKGAAWDEAQQICWSSTDSYFGGPVKRNGYVWMTWEEKTAPPANCDACESSLKACQSSYKACESSLNEWDSAPAIVSEGFWTTRRLNGQKIITFHGFSLVAPLNSYSVSFDECVNRCSQSTSCHALDYDKNLRACSLANGIDSWGIRPKPNHDSTFFVN
ncbi:hypothetical protein BDV25DRAFT_143535 [Aspergillus avenaceus]|uniref:Apple domain-containing protein n=1 Tax=Aspergillus avenaceus TaxID=36643 RepID=A0A5N6TJR4_ASPAV|nr:hypothetical protein BDV25DRAFT_143535 [Aspergillus avenaceus]